LQKESDKTFVLKGNLKLNTYYYEDGNVQFNLKEDFSHELKGEESEEFANEVLKLIETDENDVKINFNIQVQKRLDNIFENLSNEYFKPLRRKLPSKIKITLVTGKKMDWNLFQVNFGQK
jgi:hypothetical protein